ncbi:hypothetical protein SRHO_G00035120 [Serrasalmus rhombeus]
MDSTAGFAGVGNLNEVSSSEVEQGLQAALSARVIIQTGSARDCQVSRKSQSPAQLSTVSSVGSGLEYDLV